MSYKRETNTFLAFTISWVVFGYIVLPFFVLVYNSVILSINTASAPVIVGNDPISRIFPLMPLLSLLLENGSLGYFVNHLLQMPEAYYLIIYELPTLGFTIAPFYLAYKVSKYYEATQKTFS